MKARTSKSIRREASERCDALISEAFEHEQPVLVEALPAIGKSRGLIDWAARSGHPLTIFTDRHDLYDQYREWCIEKGFDHDEVKRLPSFHHDCPTANGEAGFDEEWKTRVRNEYGRGVGGKEIHVNARGLFDEQLPCQQNSQCPYMRDRSYDAGDYRVLIGNYKHAYSDKPVRERYVAFDEFPGQEFFLEFDQGTVAAAGSDYVSSRGDLPFEDWTDLTKKRGKVKDNQLLESWINRTFGDIERDLSGVYERRQSANAHAPLMVLAELRKTELDNRWEYADLGNGRVAVTSSTDRKMTILQPPNLGSAQSVIAVDGTPTIEMWNIVLGTELRHLPVHTDEEKNEYLRHGLQLRIIQTTQDLKPYANRNRNRISVEADLALIKRIIQREGREPAIISTKYAIQLYQENGLGDLISDVESKTLNYYGFKGANIFEHERLGVVIGTPHPGHDAVKRWGALAGFSIPTPRDDDGERLRGVEIEFGSRGDAFLHGLRENEVLQAIMRFGRRHTDNGQETAVYVHSPTLPDWVEHEVDLVKITRWEGHKNGRQKVVEAIFEIKDWQDAPWGVNDVKERIDGKYKDDETLSKRSVRSHLHRLSDAGYLRVSRGSGRGTPYNWRNVRLEEFNGNTVVTFASDTDGK